jgi:TonB family protein
MKTILLKLFLATALALTAVPVPAAAQANPNVVPPRMLSIPKPDCSEGKACHDIHGRVVLHADILENGNVGEVTVDSGDKNLTDEAISMAKGAHFQPGRLNGKPAVMNFVFHLAF